MEEAGLKRGRGGGELRSSGRGVLGRNPVRTHNDGKCSVQSKHPVDTIVWGTAIWSASVRDVDTQQ